MNELKIFALWDEEARVWVATSDDVTGLAIEAATMEALIERLKVVIPELLELNHGTTSGNIPFHLYGERSEVVALNG
jgi:hypothetical protein